MCDELHKLMQFSTPVPLAIVTSYNNPKYPPVMPT
jgi:hypothetical protein